MSVAAVTGASSGLGAAFARELAARGHDLILTARREHRLQVLATELRDRFGIDVTVIPADLALATGVTRVEAALVAAGDHLDCLVNNAGLGLTAPLIESALSPLIDTCMVNNVALMRLTRAAARLMATRRTGHILNVASVAAFQPGPGMAVYFASKAFTLSFSAAIGHECRALGVTVSTLCPGPIATEFGALSAIERTRLFHWCPPTRPERIATLALDQLLRGRRLIVPTLFDKLVLVATRLAPLGLQLLVSAWLLRYQDDPTLGTHEKH